MEPENLETEGHLAPLKKVTPLSKYLAMALFIIMPFIGGYIGYTYAPEKVVEVERIVVKEVGKSNLIVNQDYNFSFEKPQNWELEVKTENNGREYYLILPGEEFSESESIRVRISPNYLEGAATISTESFDIEIPENWPVKNKRLICEPSDNELPEGFVRSNENLLEFCKSNDRMITILTNISVNDNFAWAIQARYGLEDEKIFEDAIRHIVSSFEYKTNTQ